MPNQSLALTVLITAQGIQPPVRGRAGCRQLLIDSRSRQPGGAEFGGGEPQRPVFAFHNGTNIHVQATPGRLAAKGEGSSVAKSERAVLQPHPEAAVARARQAGHHAACKIGDAGKVKQFEFDPIKTNQPRRGSEPEITVPRLCDGGDTVCRQTILPAPRPAIVLLKVSGRIQGKRMGQQEQKKQSDAKVASPRTPQACS